MAHRKFTHDKIQTVMPTWHGLEERSEKLDLGDNWLTQWDHRAEPLYFQNDTDEFKKADQDETDEINYQSRPRQLRCTDNENIIVGPSYNARTFRPITNSEFLNLVQDCVGGTDHELVSVGSVRNRGRVFVGFKLMGMEKFVAAGRETFAYLNFGNGNDKSSVLFVSTSNVVSICDNTYSFNLHQVENKNKDNGTQLEDEMDVKARVRHTKNAMLKLPELAQLVDKAVGVQRSFIAEMDKLAGISFDSGRAEKLFAGFLGRKIEMKTAESFSTRSRNQTEELVKLFKNGRGNNGSDLASAFNAVTDFYTHGFRNKNDRNMEKQFISSEFGTAATTKIEFYNGVTDADRVKEWMKKGDALLALN